MERELSNKREVLWLPVLWYIHLYILGIYGFYRLVTDAMWLTVFFTIIIISMGTLGITLGAHRLWAHEAFEAHWLVRLTFMMFHTLAGVGPIYDWVLAHRLHHKYYGTDKDLYNHNKGFLYSHFVTNVMTYPENYERISKAIDMRDIESDRIIWVQRKFYWPLFLIFGLLLSINAPAEYWNESIGNAIFVAGFLRLLVLVNISWLVNSAMHVWGLKQKDKYPPDDNSVFLLNRSFWLSYHYLLPWDWKTDEFGGYETSVTSFVVKSLAEFGLIQGLKTASSESVREALYKAVTSKKSMAEALEEVKKEAEYETARMKLRYYH